MPHMSFRWSDEETTAHRVSHHRKMHVLRDTRVSWIMRIIDGCECYECAWGSGVKRSSRCRLEIGLTGQE